MDELLNDFLIETSEQLEAVSSQLVLFERNPSDAQLIASIFRLVHTIKGTCGFLGLNRLQRLAHAAEGLIGRIRDGEPGTKETVSLTLASFDRIRLILSEIERNSAEPEGDDADLIFLLEDEAPLAAEPQQELAESAEAQIGEAAVRSGEGAVDLGSRNATVRVAVGALERIMTLVSELVLTRNQLLEVARGREEEAIKAPLQRLSALTSDLQDGVMRARMQPIGRLFANLPRLVRDLSRDLGKKIDLATIGSDTELDRQLIELIRDPLTHMIRNAADHGLETPEERRAAGKPETGVISIAASHEAGHITIVISDDGRGIDVERIRRKAEALGLADASELAAMSGYEVCRFVFAPGFSTAEKVTNVSGRGVGMDVVRDNVESIGGTVSLSTVAGQGTVFTLKIPLTLAIAPALIVEVRGHRFALPQHAVVEAVSAGDDHENKLQTIQGALLLRLRDRVIPVADLGAALIGKRSDLDGERLVVVMRVGVLLFGVLVDQVSDVQEIVIKPLGRSLSHLPLFSGNTILGDGSVVLIFDPPALAQSVGFDVAHNYSIAALEESAIPPQETTRLILFRDGDGARKALPLSVIARIETVEPNQIAKTDGMTVMQYQGKLMPLISSSGSVMDFIGAKPVLVIGVGAEPMGLLVSEIVDVIEERLEIQIAGATTGVIGAANLRDEPTEILDIAHFMKIARPGAFSRGHAQRFRVLLVDDKQFFRDMLAPIVTAAGFEVCTAGSAREALALFAKGISFDAVLTDIDMPEMNGYKFARTLLEEGRHANLPILALDAHASQAVRAAARSAGMRGACGKFDRASLLAWLAEALDATAFNAKSLEAGVISEEAA
jgi:two-component system, chemotaxis family, sensor kinase CheA